MPIGPELEDSVKKAISAVIDGVKRIEYTSPYWKVTAYKVITNIRVDIKQINKVKEGL